MNRPANENDLNAINIFRNIDLFFNGFLIIDLHGAIGLLSDHANIHR